MENKAILKSKPFIFLSVVMLLYLLARIMDGNYRIVDSYEYIKSAEMILNGHFFGHAVGYLDAFDLTLRTIGYPLVATIAVMTNDLALIVFQTLLGILNIFLILKIYSRMGGKKYSIVAFFLFFTPAFFIYTHLIMSETVSLTLILLMQLILMYPLTQKRFLLLQVIVAALSLFKPVYYLFPIVNLLLFFWYFYKTRKFHWAVFIPIITVLLYFQFNEYRTGYYHYSSIQNKNIINFNLKFFKINKEGEAKTTEWLDSVHGVAEKYPDFKDKNEYYNKVGKEEVKKNLASYSFYHFYTSVRGVFDPGRYDIFTTFNFDKKERPKSLMLLNQHKYKDLWRLVTSQYGLVLLVLLPIFMVIVFKYWLLFLYAFKNYRQMNFAAFYLLIFALYNIFMAGPINSARYMLMIQGIVIVYASLCLEKRIEKKREIK